MAIADYPMRGGMKNRRATEFERRHVELNVDENLLLESRGVE